jgi:hypothetical protein
VEAWRAAWRVGVCPQLSDDGLRALARALAEDGPRLLQGQTVDPPPGVKGDEPCRGACLVGFAGWVGDGLATAGEVETFFAGACRRADEALGEPAGTRWLLDFFDETGRDEMRRRLLPEVRLALAAREGGGPC